MEKRYSEDEVRKIIKSATQIQNEDLESDILQKDGISLQELEKISEEVGLKREYLRAAAFKYDNQLIKKYSDANQTHNYEERDIAVEIDENAWEELVSELRHHFGTAYGGISEDPRRLECSHMSLAGIETKVSITNRGDNARLRLSQRVGLAGPVTESIFYGTIASAVFGRIVYMGYDLSLFASTSASLAFFMLSVFGIYALDMAWRKKKHGNLSKLADKLVEQLINSRKTDAKKKLKFETEISVNHFDKTLKNNLHQKNGASTESRGSSKGKNRI